MQRRLAFASAVCIATSDADAADFAIPVGYREKETVIPGRHHRAS